MNLLKGPGAEGETCYTRNQLAAANISEGLQELSTDVTVRRHSQGFKAGGKGGSAG